MYNTDESDLHFLTHWGVRWVALGVDQLDLFHPVEVVLRGYFPGVYFLRDVPHVDVLDDQGLNGGLDDS